MGIRNEAVAIGKLERFVADTNLANGVVFGEKKHLKALK